MSDSKFDDLKAKEKLARLLAAMNVPRDNPRGCRADSLRRRERLGRRDCGASRIRHGYVHPNKKRRKM